MRRLLAALVAVAAATCASAQDYRFRVPRVLLEAHVGADGVVTLETTFRFENEPGAHPIDWVDVGLPGGDWTPGTASATLDGQPLSVIERSRYVEGLAVGLGPRAIPPGGSGVVAVTVPVGGLLFGDTTDETHASLRITPTWFGAQYVAGESEVRVVVHLPPGIPADALRWQHEPWDSQVVVEATATRPEHAAVVFDETYRLTGPWPNGGSVGVSFPAAGIAGVQRQTTWDLVAAWAARPEIRLGCWLAFAVGFTIAFFVLTRGTGCVVWLVLLGGSFVATIVNTAAPWIAWAVAVPLFVVLFRARARRKRSWLPAVASVEGGDIKRGLTAPEAACLLDVPRAKVLLLVLHGLAKKRLAVIEPDEAGRVRARAAKGFGLSPEEDVQSAAEIGTILHPYESAFLARLRSEEALVVEGIDWEDPLRGLYRHAAQRVVGHDLEATRTYYRSLVARAWTEASAAGTLAIREEAVERNFDWMLLDETAYRRFDQWGPGFHWGPRWMSRRTPLPAGAAPAAPSTPRGTPPPAPPSTRDAASALGGRLETLASGLAGSLGLAGGPGFDLSGVDRVSASAFKGFLEAAAKGGGGGFSGGGSCACACAGCACACACAGGGR